MSMHFMDVMVAENEDENVTAISPAGISDCIHTITHSRKATEKKTVFIEGLGPIDLYLKLRFLSLRLVRGKTHSTASSF